MTEAKPKGETINLTLVGAGNIGSALLAGWCKNLADFNFSVFETNPSSLVKELVVKHGLALNPLIHNLSPDVIVLAVKPQNLDFAAPVINDLCLSGNKQPIIISILAGKKIDDILKAVPASKAVVRVMPNLPATVSAGITALMAKSASEKQEKIAEQLFRAVGEIIWINDEDKFDAITALSGSGPAYLFYFIEVLAESGVALGLPMDLAQKLARSNVIGAVKMLEQSTNSPKALRQMVTSERGTTEAALKILMAENGLQKLMLNAMKAAKVRSEELAKS